MNIEQAKTIPLQQFVEQLGGKYSHKRNNHEVWFYSPFRQNEKSASFKVNEQNNTWHDFGHISPSGNDSRMGSGGDILDLYCDYYNIDRKTGIKTALNGLGKFYTGSLHVGKAVFATDEKILVIKQPRFRILKLYDNFFHPALKQELARRRIAVATAKPYLKQAYLQDTKIEHRRLNAFAFENDRHSYEISIPNPKTNESFKTAISPKGITTIPGADKSQALVFEGFWDFITYLQMNKLPTPAYDCYVLNSVSFCSFLSQKLIARKAELKHIQLYLNEDEAGIKATNHILETLEPYDFSIGTMEHLYKGFNDLSKAWMNKASSLQNPKPL